MVIPGVNSKEGREIGYGARMGETGIVGFSRYVDRAYEQLKEMLVSDGNEFARGITFAFKHMKGILDESPSTYTKIDEMEVLRQKAEGRSLVD